MSDGDPFDIEALYPGYTNRLFHIESGNDPNVQPTGSNRGLGQFSPDLEKKYGITDANRTDRGAQQSAVNQEAAEHYQMLTNKLGRPPTASELYLTHQQGVAGGPSLLTASQDQPAWMAVRPYYGSDRMAQLAIGGNVPAGSPLSYVPTGQITAGQFRDMWSAKFNGTPMSPGPVRSAMQQQAPSVQPGLGDAEAAAATAAQTGASGSSNPLANAAMGLLKQQPLQPAPAMQLTMKPKGANPFLQRLIAAMQQQDQPGSSSPA